MLRHFEEARGTAERRAWCVVKKQRFVIIPFGIVSNIQIGKNIINFFPLYFQIVSAVQYCHQKKIIHRDLKVTEFNPNRLENMPT